jgi:hypothetical protein
MRWIRAKAIQTSGCLRLTGATMHVQSECCAQMPAARIAFLEGAFREVGKQAEFMIGADTFLLLRVEQPIDRPSSYNLAFYIETPTPLSN